MGTEDGIHSRQRQGSPRVHVSTSQRPSKVLKFLKKKERNLESERQRECTLLHWRGDVTTQGEHIKLFMAVCEVGFVAEINKIFAVDNSKLFFFFFLSV